MLNKQRDKLILLSAVFVITLLVGSLFIDRLISDKKKYYLAVQSELLDVKYKSVYKYLKIMSSDIHLMYSQNERLIKALKKAKHGDTQEKEIQRAYIYKILKRNYKRLQHMGISQVHFHTTDNKSFLRMFNPSVYGDDLGKIRPSIVQSNLTLKEQHGFEACKYMVGLRFVYPMISKDGEHLGSVEVAFSSAYILKSIIDDFVYDAHVLISKSIATGTIMEREYPQTYKNSWESDDYYIEISTHKRINDKQLYDKIATEMLKQEIHEGIENTNPFSIAALYNYQNIILTFLPLAGNQDIVKNISYVVTYTESDYLSNIELEHEYLKILFFTVIMLLYFFSIYVILNREKLKNLALYDALTKLPNRTLFSIEFQNEINRAYRYENQVALLFIDLDGFKAVNDTYGHQTGDALLQKVAKVLKASIRKSDIASRLSGDEFTVILTDIKGEKEAETVADEIIKELNKDIIINHKVINIGASIGISIYPDHAKNTTSLIQYADSMMYRSKTAGKNQVTIYSKQGK